MLITASQYLNNLNTEKHYTGVFHYTRPVRSKHDRFVEIYGLLSVKSDVVIPSGNIAKFAWDGIVDGFEYSKVDSMNEALKISLTEATRRIKQLISNDKKISEYGVDVSITVFVSSPSGMYIGYLGECDIYIYKDGKIVNIYEMLMKKDAKTAGLLLESDDIIFSSTEGFFKRNMEKIVGLPHAISIAGKIDEISNDLKDGEGLLFFTKSNESQDLERIPLEEDLEFKEVADTDSKIEKKVYISSEKRENFTKIKLQKEVQGIKIFFLKVWGIICSVFKKLAPLYRIIKGLVDSVWRNLNKVIERIFKGLSKKRWFKKASAKVSQSELNIPKREGFKSFKVDGYKIKNKKLERFKIAILAILGVALVLGGIRVTINEKEARDISKEANQIFESVEKYISSAEVKKTVDRLEAETLVFRASNELNNVPDTLREKDLQKLKDLEARVLGIQDDLYKRSTISESDGSLEKYIGTRLEFAEGSDPSDIAIYQDSRGKEYLVVSDVGLKAVYRISLYDKKVERLSDPDGLLQEPKMVYITSKGLYVLDLKIGIVKAEFNAEEGFGPFKKLTGLSIDNIGGNKISEFAILTDDDNAYILNGEEGVLLKVFNYETGYGTPFKYIEDDALKNASDIFADFSVYILTPGANGLKKYIYSDGKQIPGTLEIVGVNGEFKKLTYGYTRGESTYDLYVFDSEDMRILRFEKPIEIGNQKRHPNQILLKNQYLYRGTTKDTWKDVKDFVVVKNQETMYILDSSTIWKIRL